RKRDAEEMAPAFSSSDATLGRLAPRGTTIVTGCRAGPPPRQPWTSHRPTAAAISRAAAAPKASSFLMRGSDRLHHQAGVGASEAEAVVQHRLDLPLLGDERDEVDAG